MISKQHNKGLLPPGTPFPEPDSLGKAAANQRRTRKAHPAVQAAAQAGKLHAQQFTPGPNLAKRMARSYARNLVPHRKRRGRPRQARITRAVALYRQGIRGLRLYRETIRNYDRMSHWRRRVEARRLLAATRKRLQREDGDRVDKT